MSFRDGAMLAGYAGFGPAQLGEPDRGELAFSRAPVRETLLGMVDTAGDAKRRQGLDRIRDCGRCLV